MLENLPLIPLAEGRTAEIYPWDEDHVLKLFRDWCPSGWVEYEARIAHAIYEAGIPSPAVGETIEVNGRRGLLYERLDGISMLQDMNSRPWKFLEHARSLAELQVKINRQSIQGLPSYKSQLRRAIHNTQHLTWQLKNKALAGLDILPDGKNVCHGDYHPGNVIITKRGLIVIDWMAACSGSRWADVARSSLIFRIGARAAGKQVHHIVRLMIRLYHRAYLNRYQAFVADSGNELKRWMPVMAAARLNEDILPEREPLIKLVKDG